MNKSDKLLISKFIHTYPFRMIEENNLIVFRKESIDDEVKQICFTENRIDEILKTHTTEEFLDYILKCVMRI